MRSGNRIALSAMVDLVDLVVISVNPTFDVLQSRVVLPRPLPQLVHNIEELFSPAVTLIVSDYFVVSVVLESIFQVAGDNIPSDPPAREVIKRREAPRECKRRFLHDRRSNRDRKMLGVASQR